MAKKVYIDTSVVGGYFDEEFEFWTKIFFESVRKHEFRIVISELLTEELKHAPEFIRDFLNEFPSEHKVYIELTEEVFKHIVNLNKIHLYNGVNLQMGYRTVEIRTPREIVNYED